MIAAVDVTYDVPEGEVLHAGRRPPGAVANRFDSVAIWSESTGVPTTNPDQVPLWIMHGSGGQNSTAARQFIATVSGSLAYKEFTTFRYRTSAGLYGTQHVTNIRPQDLWGAYPSNPTGKRESHHLGFFGLEHDPLRVHLITERLYDALIQWAFENVPNCDWSRMCATGGSMGGWGCMTYAMRRAQYFAAVMADRPRWRCNGTPGKIAVTHFIDGTTAFSFAAAPMLSEQDGGYSVAVHKDLIAFVSNPANKVPFIGWCCGRQDGFANFEEQCDAVDALRAAGRPFAFVWNNGTHSAGAIIDQITDSYTYASFKIGRGMPLFTEHSRDKDPRDAINALVGGINEGLKFKPPVETATTWSCEVTSILGACSVKVKPYGSSVFKADVAAKTVNITGANVWQTVTFTI
ncbi:hypothetical protein [Massilia soli]|uniref:Peptidase S9 prolyl oligopeptidase catalytic domain-containing protein n=1 Tax=Massilia soli TaxID=2792854 RepID=A0ABS7SRB4_9BURK|nr:hypothetical protein [Massilia soli]MBZ2208481.1 hypothetical protein [Massilia soli]